MEFKTTAGLGSHGDLINIYQIHDKSDYLSDIMWQQKLLVKKLLWAIIKMTESWAIDKNTRTT